MEPAEEEPTQGEIEQPAREEPAEAEAAQPVQEEPVEEESGPAARVLLLDDEANILNSLQRLLRRDRFDVTATTDPHEALRSIEESDFAVIISDERMPIMNGTDFLEKAREIKPDSVRILLTGYADVTAAVKAINQGAVYRFLTKPWQDDELRLTVKQAVDQFNLVQENKRLNAQLKELNQNLKKRVLERTWQIVKLNQDLEASFRGSIEIMSQITEMHSQVIRNHARRVADLARALGQRLGMTSDELKQLEMAALLHDIGKVSISASILTKPEEQLQPYEKVAIMHHPVLGESLVRKIASFDEAATYIRHLHERMDGSGYPDRLLEDQIPLGSRILAVANRFDEILNARKMHASSSPEEALQVLARYTIGEFDPVVCETLAEMLGSEESLIEALQEIEVTVDELRVGSIVSRDILDHQGEVLLARNSRLDNRRLSYLKELHESRSLADSVHVFRNQGPG